MSDALRGPLVLCYLQGRTRDEAAQSLGLSLATLKRRLERGRDVLRIRLTRRGLALSAIGGAMAVEDRLLPAATPSQIAKAISTDNVSTMATSLIAGTFTTGKKCIAVSLVAAVGLAAGWLLTTSPQPPVPPSIILGPERPPPAAVDVSHDPLPDGAISRLGTTRLRPGARISAMAFSPDGKQLAYWATGWGDHSHDRLVFADPTNGRELKAIPAGPSDLISMQWLADGRVFALMKTDAADYFLWEFTARNSSPQISDRADLSSRMADQIITSAISPDGRWMATGRMSLDGKDRPIELWDVRSNSRLSDLTPKVLGKHAGHGLFVKFSGDGRLLFALSGVDRTPNAPLTGAATQTGFRINPRSRSLRCLPEKS